jgi:hypothetical protein
MTMKKEQTSGTSRKWATGVALVLAAVAMNAAAGPAAKSFTITVYGEKQQMTTQSKFYCDIKALTPEERARHKQLGDKLKAARKAIVETPKGYEFQYSPADVTVGEVAEWVVAESKCCPFFDFHIDLENEGKLICLRLTGEEGIKEFIQGEFKVNEVK